MSCWSPRRTCRFAPNICSSLPSADDGHAVLRCIRAKPPVSARRVPLSWRARPPWGCRRRPDHKSVRPLEYSTPAFTVDLKIPDPYNKDQPLWPPLQLTPSQQLARAMLANPDAYTDRFVLSEAAAGTYIEARNRRVLEDNRRQIAEAERSQREREQREAAEMAKIKEADVGRAAG